MRFRLIVSIQYAGINRDLGLVQKEEKTDFEVEDVAEALRRAGELFRLTEIREAQDRHQDGTSIHGMVMRQTSDPEEPWKVVAQY